MPDVTGKGSEDTGSPGKAGGFLWVPKRSCPNVVQPLTDHWLKEVPYQFGASTFPKIMLAHFYCQCNGI